MSSAIVSTRYVGDCRYVIAYTFPILRVCSRCQQFRACYGSSTQTWFTPDGRVDFRATRPLCVPCFAVAREWVLGKCWCGGEDGEHESEAHAEEARW